MLCRFWCDQPSFLRALNHLVSVHRRTQGRVQDGVYRQHGCLHLRCGRVTESQHTTTRRVHFVIFNRAGDKVSFEQSLHHGYVFCFLCKERSSPQRPGLYLLLQLSPSLSTFASVLYSDYNSFSHCQTQPLQVISEWCVALNISLCCQYFYLNKCYYEILLLLLLLLLLFVFIIQLLLLRKLIISFLTSVSRIVCSQIFRANFVKKESPRTIMQCHVTVAICGCILNVMRLTYKDTSLYKKAHLLVIVYNVLKILIHFQLFQTKTFMKETQGRKKN